MRFTPLPCFHLKQQRLAIIFSEAKLTLFPSGHTYFQACLSPTISLVPLHTLRILHMCACAHTRTHIHTHTNLFRNNRRPLQKTSNRTNQEYVYFPLNAHTLPLWTLSQSSSYAQVQFTAISSIYRCCYCTSYYIEL